MRYSPPVKRIKTNPNLLLPSWLKRIFKSTNSNLKRSVTSSYFSRGQRHPSSFLGRKICKKKTTKKYLIINSSSNSSPHPLLSSLHSLPPTQKEKQRKMKAQQKGTHLAPQLCPNPYSEQTKSIPGVTASYF